MKTPSPSTPWPFDAAGAIHFALTSPHVPHEELRLFLEDYAAGTNAAAWLTAPALDAEQAS